MTAAETIEQGRQVVEQLVTESTARTQLLAVFRLLDEQIGAQAVTSEGVDEHSQTLAYAAHSLTDVLAALERAKSASATSLAYIRIVLQRQADDNGTEDGAT